MTIFKQIVQNFKVKTILLNAVQTLFNSHVNKYQELISGNRTKSFTENCHTEDQTLCDRQKALLVSECLKSLKPLPRKLGKQN